MGLRTMTQTKTASVLVGFGLLAAVGYLDYITGFQITFSVFYLLPILFVLRQVGQGFAFAMAVISVAVSQLSDIGAGEHYPDLLTPVWNMAVHLAIFLLVIILFSARDDLRKQVEQRTEKLQKEIQVRIRLEKELLETVELEQRRIGHDLHDSLGQHLTATALAGKSLSKKLANKSMAESAAADRLIAMVEEAIELTRKLARSLHPIELRAGGLTDALQDLTTNVSQAFNVSCRFEHSGTVILPDYEAAIHLYRIGQEAVSNAIRHGRARNIIISLNNTSESIMLTITDNGIGLPTDASAGKGMGLRIMHYRASMIGATFDIQNLPAGGARAVCVLSPGQPKGYAAEN